MKAKFLQQLLCISALSALSLGTAAADPSYVHFEFGERYDKAARSVVPGFAVKSLTRTPPVNIMGGEKGTSRKSPKQAKQELTKFEPAPAPATSRSDQKSR